MTHRLRLRFVAAGLAAALALVGCEIDDPVNDLPPIEEDFENDLGDGLDDDPLDP